MGEAKRRRREFLVRNPLCCFCGGGVSATTEDHVPPKAAFFARNWPEGYCFPACIDCNGGSSDDDRKFAFLSRLPLDRYESEQHRDEFRRLTRGVHRQDSSLIRGLLMSANEKRTFLKDRRLNTPPGTAVGELPLMKFGPEWAESATNVLQKLAKALHYMHAGKIVPIDGRVDVSVFPNSDIMAGDFDASVFTELPASVLPIRNRKDISDQFGYRYGVTEDGKHALFVARFGQSFVAALHTSCAPDELSDPEVDINSLIT
jgi:hypothetical protein